MNATNLGAATRRVITLSLLSTPVKDITVPVPSSIRGSEELAKVRVVGLVIETERWSVYSRKCPTH
jgi:hypothetical protein